jgi:hypothetical protein
MASISVSAMFTPMHTKPSRLSTPLRIVIPLLGIMLFHSSPSPGEEPYALSGKLDLHRVQALEEGSVREDTSLLSRLKLDQEAFSWKIHSWLEGGWDGAVKNLAQDHALVKNYDQVYQRHTPYLEFKELYAAHAWSDWDVKAGIQRFAWGRLDEYPPNDLLNPWDYTQFIRKPLEDRKIGMPSVAITLNRNDWSLETVWIPVMVPYRLPLTGERWAGSSFASSVAKTMPNAVITVQEPDLPERTVKNSNGGIRLKSTGTYDWALNAYHGYDTRPVFKTTTLVISPTFTIDPGYVPDFHRITVIGLDAAVVKGDLSVRAELAYTFNRMLNIRRELWGYPAAPLPGVYSLNTIGREHNAIDYGIGADYRLFEDGLLTMQARQTLILGDTSLLYEGRTETILSASLKAGWFNQKVETTLGVSYNPEHGDHMAKTDAWYVFSDAWKTGATIVAFNGPAQSFFGRYSRNDQVELDLVYSW